MVRKDFDLWKRKEQGNGENRMAEIYLDSYCCSDVIRAVESRSMRCVLSARTNSSTVWFVADLVWSPDSALAVNHLMVTCEIDI